MGAALIQQEKGQFVNGNGFVAWQGFVEHGYEVAFAEWSGLSTDRILDTPETIVVGVVGFVRKALNGLGIDPAPLDYPARLHAYLGREVRQTTLGAVRAGVTDRSPPVFVKPVGDKAFAGRLIRGFRDLIPTRELSGDVPVWTSSPLDFLSEWRCFVREGVVVGIGHYKGNPLRFPDSEVVTDVIRDYAGDAPAAYALDFGVTAEGRTVLVEANDGFSLGCYGLGPLAYTGLLEARWRQLISAVQ